MKRLIFLVVMALSAAATFAQNYSPLLPKCNYTPGTPEYRQYFFDEIQKDPDYRATLLLFVNTALKSAGEDKNLNSGKPLESIHLWWITGQIKYYSVHLGKNESFTNTRKLKTGKTEQYEDSIQKNFIAGTFNYKTCNLTFLKADCFNFINLHEAPNQQMDPEENLAFVPAPSNSAPAPKPAPNVRVVEYVYDTVYLEREKVVYKEDERARVAAETHAQNMSMNSASSYYHESSEDITQMDYHRGAGISINAGALFQTVCAAAGFGGGYQSSNYGGNAGLTIIPSEDFHMYSNSRSMSGGASSASSVSVGSGNGNNQNYQNQGRQRSGGMPQPIYGPDPNSFLGTAKTGF